MSVQPESKPIELTDKQRVFVEEYLVCWNATQAAILAGYSKKTARNLGCETLAKPYIQEIIQARLKEKHLTADEVLARLADQSRGSLSDFITLSGRGFRFDMKKAIENGKLHLIKSITKGPKGTRIELYDAQAALVHIGKHLGLFKEIHEGKVDIINMSMDEWKARQAARREQAGQAVELFEGEDG